MRYLAIAVVCLAASAAFGQTTFTNGAGLCQTPKNPTVPPPNQSLYCVAMPTSDGGYLSWIIYGQPATTFTSGTVYKVDAAGNVIFTSTSFYGTYVNNVLQGTFTAVLNGVSITGTTTQITAQVRGSCYKGTCIKRTETQAGSTTYR